MQFTPYLYHISISIAKDLTRSVCSIIPNPFSHKIHCIHSWSRCHALMTLTLASLRLTSTPPIKPCADYSTLDNEQYFMCIWARRRGEANCSGECRQIVQRKYRWILQGEYTGIVQGEHKWIVQGEYRQIVQRDTLYRVNIDELP